MEGKARAICCDQLTASEHRMNSYAGIERTSNLLASVALKAAGHNLKRHHR